MATNTVFIIYDTAGVPIAAIQPNTLNGPGGVQQSSDLSLFGLGYALWGQAADQNDYRLLENFACPDDGTGKPQSSVQLGTGNGVNVPVVGQLWFNTTQNKMFMCTATTPTAVWATVAGSATAAQGASPPASPSLGELWYDTSVPTKPQLKVWNDATVTPNNTWVSVAAQYLPLVGGTMAGSIAMGGNNITGIGTVSTAAINASYFRASNGIVTNQITIPVSGSENNIDGPRIGNNLIYHQGNPPPATFTYVAGMIIMWGGIVSNIPVGWQLCDGAVIPSGPLVGTFTPNMTNMIPKGINSGVVGSAPLVLTTSATSAGTPTGSTTLTLSNLPSHAHNTLFYTGSGIQQAGPPGTLPGSQYWFGGGGAGIAQTVTSGSVGSGTAANLVGSSLPTHTHTVTEPTVGLFFIMYIG